MSGVISIAAADFVRGGLLSDADVEIMSARWVAWDYNGAMTNADVLAAHLVLKDLSTDEEIEQHWANGKVMDFCPNPDDDGDTLIAQSEGKTKLTQGNMFLFIQSLEDNGMPPIKSGKLSELVGIRCHVERKPAPKRPGLEREKKEGRDDTVLVCTGGLKMPGDRKTTPKPTTPKGVANRPAGGSGVPKGAAASTASPASNSGGGSGSGASLSDELTSIVQSHISDILSDAGAPMKASDLKMKVFQRMKEDTAANRTAGSKAAIDLAWLTDNGFTVEGTGLTAMVSI